MNTENNVPLLSEVLDDYDNGTLDMSVLARKCYLSEMEKHYGRTTWIHNSELNGHSILRKMGQRSGRDLLRQTREKL